MSMEQPFDEAPRTYVITKSQHVGYGFTAGHEWPTMVKKVESNGPSFNRLQPGDVITAVNGIEVENVSREQIIKMIQLSGDRIEITVRKLSYGELIRAKNLADPKFYQLNRSNTMSSQSNQYSNNQRCQQPSSLTDSQKRFNRLVTSISHQQQQVPASSPSSISNNIDRSTPPVQIISSQAPGGKQVLKAKSINQSQLNITAGDEDMGKGKSTNKASKKNGTSYGRFSPILQRCKSSMDGAQANQKNKKSINDDNDQPLLKRRNTMRPIRPPPEVREILKVVIRIFFEDGQTRTLRYNPGTTVGVILEILNERLGKSPELEQIRGYFGLAVTAGVEPGTNQKKDKAPRRNLIVLKQHTPIMGIGQLPYSHRLRLLYRMTYPPSDVYSLFKQSKLAFDYLYQQSCNDLKLGGFSPRPDEDTELKLSALHLLEYVHSNHSKAHGYSKDPKIYIKLIKKNRGIEYFVPASMAESIFDKDGKKIVSQYKKLKAKLIKQLKKNFEEFNFEPPKVKSTTDINRFSTTSFHELILPEMQSSPSDYIKLLFLNYLSQLTCYGNPQRPFNASTSPIEQTSSGDCSSSLESVPRTSDSSPLIKQTRNQIGLVNNGADNSASIHNNNPNVNTYDRPENLNANNTTRLSQMHSVRSLSSVRSPSQSQSVDQPDMAATPSIESISSITFNMQNSPSPPEATPPYLVPLSETYNNNLATPATVVSGYGPSPMPRHQTLPARRPDFSSIDKLYNQRYPSSNRHIDDLLKNIIILPPPPPPSSLMFDNITYQLANDKSINYNLPASRHLTQVLTDKDIERLRVPPPPRMMNHLVLTDRSAK